MGFNVNEVYQGSSDHLKSEDIGNDFITYVANRTRDDRIQGNRYPVTYNGLKTAWRRSRSKSDVKDFRFHDMRHTAATRLLRATGNLRLAQRLLGHSDIQTTTKYAHVTNDDLRDGLDKVDGLAARNGTKNGTNTTTKGVTSGNIKEN